MPSLIPPDLEPPAAAPSRAARRLSEADAIDVWIARWLRLPRKELLARYGCDPRRIYEVWSGERYPAAKSRAWKLFTERYPQLVDRVDTGNHRTFHRNPDSDGQLNLFK